MSASESRKPPTWVASAGGIVRSFERYLQTRRPKEVVVTWEGVFVSATGPYKFYSRITAQANGRKWVYIMPGFAPETDYPFRAVLGREGYLYAGRASAPGRATFTWRRPPQSEERPAPIRVFAQVVGDERERGRGAG
jgi:hypothetical protein